LRTRGLISAALALALSACGAPEPGAGDASAGREAGAERGALLSLACQACHSLDAGAAHMIGPNLNGVFGRRAGSVGDFVGYSDALRGAGFVWTPERLDQWLEDPAGFLPGTAMAFTGYRSAEDRAALIDYLVAATAAD